MSLKTNFIWILLAGLAVVFSIAYAWSAIFPGPVAPEALRYFTPGQVAHGREYNQAIRLTFVMSFIIKAALLSWLIFSGSALALSRWSQKAACGSYWGSILLFFLALWLVLRLTDLPFTLFDSYYWQHRWGFSTQSLWAWWVDYLKGAGLDLGLSAAGVLLFFWILGRWPNAWWLAGSILFSLWLLFQVYLWPVLVSPLFNRFEEVRDPRVATMVRDLAEKAGIKVDRVLVMDASTRTTMANAYFTGLGNTKRIVLYDTLLSNYPPEEVREVVAHEMAHWQNGHITRGLAMGIVGVFIAWGLLFLALRTMAPLSGRFPPQTWAVVILFILLISFVSSPLQNFFSRQMENEADLVAVQLTGDPQTSVRLHIRLAEKNMSDVSPPPFIRWFSYSHPPAPSRIENISRWAATR